MTLNDWITASGFKRCAVARKLGMTELRFYRLCRSTVKPKLEEVANICKLTKGAVKPQDFINQAKETAK